MDGIHSINEHQSSDHPMFKFTLAILESTYHRKESKGTHYYLNYPKASDSPRHSMVNSGKEVLHIDNLNAISV